MVVAFSMLGMVSAASAKEGRHGRDGEKDWGEKKQVHRQAVPDRAYVFERMDKNEDGVVDREEFKQFHKKLHAKRSEARREKERRAERGKAKTERKGEKAWKAERERKVERNSGWDKDRPDYRKLENKIRKIVREEIERHRGFGKFRERPYRPHGELRRGRGYGYGPRSGMGRDWIRGRRDARRTERPFRSPGFYLMDKDCNGEVEAGEIRSAIRWLEEALEASEKHPLNMEKWQDITREHYGGGLRRPLGMGGIGGGYGRGR